MIHDIFKIFNKLKIKLNNFFQKRKMILIAYGEPNLQVRKKEFYYSIMFYENDNNKRIYKVDPFTGIFCDSKFYIECKTWKAIGLLPTWALDATKERQDPDYD